MVQVASAPNHRSLAKHAQPDNTHRHHLLRANPVTTASTKTQSPPIGTVAKHVLWVSLQTVPRPRVGHAPKANFKMKKQRRRTVATNVPLVLRQRVQKHPVKDVKVVIINLCWLPWRTVVPNAPWVLRKVKWNKNFVTLVCKGQFLQPLAQPRVPLALLVDSTMTTLKPFRCTTKPAIVCCAQLVITVPLVVNVVRFFLVFVFF